MSQLSYYQKSLISIALGIIIIKNDQSNNNRKIEPTISNEGLDINENKCIEDRINQFKSSMLSNISYTMPPQYNTQGNLYLQLIFKTNSNQDEVTLLE